MPVPQTRAMLSSAILAGGGLRLRPNAAGDDDQALGAGVVRQLETQCCPIDPIHMKKT